MAVPADGKQPKQHVYFLFVPQQGTLDRAGLQSSLSDGYTVLGSGVLSGETGFLVSGYDDDKSRVRREILPHLQARGISAREIDGNQFGAAALAKPAPSGAAAPARRTGNPLLHGAVTVLSVVFMAAIVTCLAAEGIGVTNAIALRTAPACTTQTSDAGCVMSVPGHVTNRYTQTTRGGDHCYLEVSPNNLALPVFTALTPSCSDYGQIPLGAAVTLNTFRGSRIYLHLNGVRYDLGELTQINSIAPGFGALVLVIPALMIGYPRWRAQRNRRRLRPAPRALAVFLWVLLPIVVLFVPIAILAPTPGVPIALGTFLADAILSLLLLRRWRSTATSVSA